MTPQDVADLTGLSYHVVLRAIKDGELQASKLRARLLIRPEAVDEWFDANIVTPVSPAAPRLDEPRRRRSRADHGTGSVARLRAIEEGAA